MRKKKYLCSVFYGIRFKVNNWDLGCRETTQIFMYRMKNSRNLGQGKGVKKIIEKKKEISLSSQKKVVPLQPISGEESDCDMV